ncbi:hypothetical protein GGR58DRAFT_504749 [Xylaria digitata]|nr:hypothetical protein GGR58DRAFT_504749 [Xylaria digitata]
MSGINARTDIGSSSRWRRKVRETLAVQKVQVCGVGAVTEANGHVTFSEDPVHSPTNSFFYLSRHRRRPTLIDRVRTGRPESCHAAGRPTDAGTTWYRRTKTARPQKPRTHLLRVEIIWNNKPLLDAEPWPGRTARSPLQTTRAEVLLVGWSTLRRAACTYCKGCIVFAPVEKEGTKVAPFEASRLGTIGLPHESRVPHLPAEPTQPTISTATRHAQVKS